MGNRCFVICDSEPSYAERLSVVLAKKINFQIHVCSSVEQLEKISREMQIGVLLLEEVYLEEETEPLAEERILLVRERGEERQEKSIYKYQSGEAILGEILSICLENSRSGIFKQQLYKDSSLLAVYSPVHRIGKTAFAIALGEELAKKERVLYLNLEEYSGFAERFQTREQYTLADLLYYTKQEQTSLGMRIEIIAGRMEALEYIAPMEVSEDLKGVTFAEWKELIEQLLAQRIYKKIILDPGESIQGLWNILDLCRKIYMPVNRTPESLAKISQFEKNAAILGHGGLLSKIEKVEPGMDLQSFVRELLQREEEEDDTGGRTSRTDPARA